MYPNSFLYPNVRKTKHGNHKTHFVTLKFTDFFDICPHGAAFVPFFSTFVNIPANRMNVTHFC